MKPGSDTTPELSDAYRSANPERKPDEATAHGFKGRRDGSRIDWILHTPEFRTIDATIDYINRDGRYPSDHYPVRATLTWAGK